MINRLHKSLNNKHLGSFLSVFSMIETLSKKELPVNVFINQNQMGHLTEVICSLCKVEYKKHWSSTSIQTSPKSDYTIICTNWMRIWKTYRFTKANQNLSKHPVGPAQVHVVGNHCSWILTSRKISYLKRLICFIKS